MELDCWIILSKTIMVNQNKNITLNFYTIKSNFSDILFSLCKKIILSDQNFYINYDKEEAKIEADKFLWTKEKNNFVPHKVYGEKISVRDKIILFNWNYSDLEVFKKFQSLIISPCVKIKKFDLFKKFLIFSYASEKKFNLGIKEKLISKGFILNWYDEQNKLKWKQI